MDNIWKNRKVLVTGATGLLGAHLLEQLVTEGAECVALVRDYVPQSRYYAPSKLFDVCEVTGDVNDYALVNRMINEYGIQTIFHLAAQTQVGVANKNPLPTLQTNIMGTVNILEAARINKVEQVVIASSDKAYGDAPVLPYDENTPLHGKHPYDVSKSCADLIAQSYHNTYGMNIGITRCGNLFGPGDLNFNRLIPGTIRSLLRGEQPVIRSDGSMIRDYFYVKDAVAAYLTLAEYRHDNPDSKYIAFNFSYGLPLSVLALVRGITYQMRVTLEPIVLGEATHEIQAQKLNSSLAHSVLNWKPLYEMEGAMEQTIRWYKENL